MKALAAIPQAVTRSEWKRAVHIDHVHEDALIDAYLVAAQEVVETATRRPLLPRAVEFNWRALSSARWWFPVAPVQSLTAVAVQVVDGSFFDIDAGLVRLEQAHDEPQLVLLPGALDLLAEGGLVRVRAEVGDALPRAALKQAIILLAKDWYEAGIAVEKKEAMDVSFGCRALMRQSIYVRPREAA